MAKYLMLGKYTVDSVKGISAERTQKAVGVIEKVGGKVHQMYVLLGGNDLALIVDLPGNTEALKASVDLAKATGIAFTTSPAVSVEEFDKLAG